MNNIEHIEELIKPKLIFNNEGTKVTVLHEIVSQLDKCDSFSFSVAFIKQSGLASIRQQLVDLKKNNKRGRIVTSNYLHFNDPEMFRDLLKIDNIDVRIYEEKGFHPKGYIFKNGNNTDILVGSSNLTQNALSVNQEWNLKLSSLLNEDIVKQVDDEFERQWNMSIDLTENWIQKYEIEYNDYHRDDFKEENISHNSIEPNIMQKEAISALAELRSENKDRALLVSATGTGKTFLSAFDVKQYNPKKMLFIVHRENIAKTAMASFMKIMPDRSCGLFIRDKHQIECDFVFATIQSLHSNNNYKSGELINRKYFDYIVVDEVHHAGAPTYIEVLNHFIPDFLLGMTATPERTDGFDIYKFFNYNIAYEIRLQQAMKYDLLCPFHYYGISDFTVNEKTINDTTEFKYLVEEDRMNHIAQAMEEYGYFGKKVHGLVFVSSIEEAKALSKYLNENTRFKSIALSGEDSEATRSEMMNRLEAEGGNDALDYIVSVNVFNEGIDIPKVNQIVMVRPTNSAIVFVQQLGRGLRKVSNKEYTVVIDIIGNYKTNFLIPVALSGDNSFNKDNLRYDTINGRKVIYGPSTISFDDIAKERIFKSIDAADFTSRSILKNSYNDLKTKLGRIPSLMDFDKYNSIDPILFFTNKNYGSYYKFLRKNDKEYDTELSDSGELFLSFVSRKLASGKRLHELLMIKLAIDHGDCLFERLVDVLYRDYGIEYQEESTKTIINELTHGFLPASENKKLIENDISFIQKRDDDYCISDRFASLLNDYSFKNLMNEIVEFGIFRYNRDYSDTYENTDLCLYKKYTYEDVCRLLNWEKSIPGIDIGGYKYDSVSNTFPVFINYEKDDQTGKT